MVALLGSRLQLAFFPGGLDADCPQGRSWIEVEMVAPRPNYGITRIDQPEKKNHGFYVRITHRDQTHQQYFPDESSGGKVNALKLAKEYRDELLSQMPRYKQEMAARKERKALQSGVEGVTHVVSEVDEGKHYEYWQASWADESGRDRTAKYSISRYGNDKALGMAINARAKAIRAQGKPVACSQTNAVLEGVDPGAAERLRSVSAQSFQQLAEPGTPSLVEREISDKRAEGAIMNTRTATCATCRHWYQEDGKHSDFGQCRRYPPEWQETSRGDWCGEINFDKTEMFLDIWQTITALAACGFAYQALIFFGREDKLSNAVLCLALSVGWAVWWIKATKRLRNWRKQRPNLVL